MADSTKAAWLEDLEYCRWSWVKYPWISIVVHVGVPLENAQNPTSGQTNQFLQYKQWFGKVKKKFTTQPSAPRMQSNSEAAWLEDLEYCTVLYILYCTCSHRCSSTDNAFRALAASTFQCDAPSTVVATPSLTPHWDYAKWSSKKGEYHCKKIQDTKHPAQEAYRNLYRYSYLRWLRIKISVSWGQAQMHTLLLHHMT